MADPAKRTRPKMIATRVDDEVFRLVKDAAAAERRNVADWVRVVIEDAARQVLAKAEKPGKKRP